MKYLLFIFILFVSCDLGLEPREVATIKCTINYSNGWPEEDSVTFLRFAAFKTDNPENLVEEVILGNVLIKEITPFVDKEEFEIEILEAPVEYKYIAVALQKTDDLFDQTAIGVYADNDIPIILNVELGKTYEIEINVDFDDLPPQIFN